MLLATSPPRLLLVKLLSLIMQGIESNFEKYTRTMSEQLAEQMRRWEENMKKREEVMKYTCTILYPGKELYTENCFLQELEKREKESKRHRSMSKKKKKNKKYGYSETSETGSTSGSELETSGLIQPSAKIVVTTKPAVSFMLIGISYMPCTLGYFSLNKFVQHIPRK